MTIEEAVKLYQDRQSRAAHPNGKFDSKRRWYPSDEEERDCCKSVRSPSVKWPYSLMHHCRTIGHIARLCGVDLTELRKAVRAANPPELTASKQAAQALAQRRFYKAVAVVDGQYRSIYDNTVIYEIGRCNAQAARENHRGGYYVYETPEAAEQVKVPEDSENRDAPRAILWCKCGGRCIRYANGKLAFTRITPLGVII